MDNAANLLLTAEILRLDQGLVRGEKVNGTFAFKRVATQTYLTVDERQARLLEEFAQPMTVPQALEGFIRNRICIALPEFYDLILKAYRAGVLRRETPTADTTIPVERAPVRWFLALRPPLLLPFAGAGLVATLAAFAFAPLAAPASGLDWLVGWLATCGALSTGQLLAATALRGAGGEVHHPRFRWLTPLPHFAVDLRDACRSAGSGRAAVASAVLLPLALTAAAVVCLRPTWAVVPTAAMLLMALPVGDLPIAQLLRLLRRRPLIDTDHAPLFKAELRPGEKWRFAWRRFDARVAVLQLAAGVGWALAVGHLAYQLRQQDLWPVLRDWATWRQTLLGIALALGLLIASGFALQVREVMFAGISAAWRRGMITGRRWWRGRNATVDKLEVEGLIRRHPLLGRLDPTAQGALAALLRPKSFRAWQTIIRFDTPPDFVGLILSGRATLYRRLKSGRKARFIPLVEGDLFGANDVVGSHQPVIEVRTATPLVALTLSREDFQRLVIGPLGSPVVASYVDKHIFLQRASAMCAAWHPAAVARFAELAGIASYVAGTQVLVQGGDVGSVYVLYEGRARALRDRKPIGKIEPGDFFGEISLLQNSVATADVEMMDDASCLSVNRVEFIRFMSRNARVALQMERLCSERLGYPIFPLKGQSFDVR